jgi:cardiolipin synthase
MLDILHEHFLLVIAALYALLEVLAIAAAIHAVMNVRTAQGATAWFVALITMPFVALPLYGIFGRRRFMGYVAARRAGDAAIEHTTRIFSGDAGAPFRSALDPQNQRFSGFEKISGTPFLNANRARLLVDGTKTFDAIFQALSSARNYVLVQFYIIRNDDLGQRLKQHLLECLSRGVRVYVLYDAVGSHGLDASYSEELASAGAAIHAFTGTTSRVKRLQINFRNHRKNVVVDGRTTFVGGHNVGDEYLGLDPRLTPWRDTHVAVHGPLAVAAQIPFVEDWYWTTGELPIVDWKPESGGREAEVGGQEAEVGGREAEIGGQEAGIEALSLPSGPADDVEAGSLLFVHAIHAARQRLWIVSPYFVPNGSIIDALKLAALRGVDVRILLPGLSDNRLVQLAGRAYYPELLPSGVRIFRYTSGFLHQKVMLIDDDLATIGTANLDNRSMRLNFELTLIFADRAFGAEVETMLDTDFDRATEIHASDFRATPWWSRAAARGARLLSPVL